MQAMVASTQQLAELIAAFMGRVHRESSSQWFQVVEELDLSLTQLKMLSLLDGAGELGVKETGARLGLSLPAASRAVDHLVQRGLLERREKEADRRCRLVQLTSAGHAVVERLTAARVSSLHDFVATLPDAQRAALHAALAPLGSER
jgi:DNA-binding MarR family transcriptional regulator